MYTILIIDDHKPTLDTLCLILEAKGYVALGAPSSAQAESYFRDKVVDLVIVDHGLPGITGEVLAAQLKALRSVPVLMMSGNPELKEKPYSVDLLLPKPQKVEDLLDSVEYLILESARELRMRNAAES